LIIRRTLVVSLLACLCTICTASASTPDPAVEQRVDTMLGKLSLEQKVDLTKLSILELADQYLAFIARARTLRLEKSDCAKLKRRRSNRKQQVLLN